MPEIKIGKKIQKKTISVYNIEEVEELIINALQLPKGAIFRFIVERNVFTGITVEHLQEYKEGDEVGI